LVVIPQGSAVAVASALAFAFVVIPQGSAVAVASALAFAFLLSSRRDLLLPLPVLSV
jgi:hypothetical protein